MSTIIKAKLQDVKRSLILEEAAVLFETEGYEQLKVSDLAKRVGVSVGTIYGLFESKEGLYMAYVRVQIAQFLDAFEARCAEIDDPEAQMEALLTLKFNRFVTKRKAVEEFAKNNPLFFSNIRHREQTILEKVYVKFAQIIVAIEPKKSEAEALQLAYLIGGLSDGYLTHWLEHGGDLLSQVPELRAQTLMLIKGC